MQGHEGTAAEPHSTAGCSKTSQEKGKVPGFEVK